MVCVHLLIWNVYSNPLNVLLFFFNFVSEHFLRFELNTDVANRVNAEIVTKAETATIGELISYMKQEGAKVQYFILSSIR